VAPAQALPWALGMTPGLAAGVLCGVAFGLCALVTGAFRPRELREFLPFSRPAVAAE